MDKKRPLILSREEILQIEEETEKQFGINKLILMENAGRTLAESLYERFTSIKKHPVFIFSGKGNNGGDGFVAARYLFNMGASVKVWYLGEVEKFTSISFTNFQILLKMNIETYSLDKEVVKDIIIPESAIIIDAILGIGVRYNVRSEVSELIYEINQRDNFVVSADIPSGLHPDTGDILGVGVKSNLTISIGFGKKGFYINKGPDYCGEIKVVDIGFPCFFYKK